MKKDEIININMDNSSLTFEGNIFIGYENQTSENLEKDRIGVSRMLSLNYATWAAGMGGSLLALIEIYKSFPRWMPFSTVFYLLLFGGAIGIAITIIIPNLGERVKRWLDK